MGISGHKYKGCKCSTPNLTAEEIQSAFLSAANELIANKNEIIANLREGMVIASDTTELEKSRDAAKDEMVLLSDMIENLISENARIAQDQAEYNKKYNTLIERFKAAKTQYESFEQQIEDTHRRVKRIEAFINNVRELGPLTEFDEELWGVLVESVTVYSKDDIRVEFRN